MGKKVYGKCALCLKKRELQNSHFMPKGFYKAIMAKKNDKIVNNFKSSNTAGYGVQQLTAYLLCLDCEDKLNKNGEKVVIQECYRYYDKKFDLLTKANLCNTSSSKANIQEVLEPQSANIDTAKYLYFALSMIWRKSIIKWRPEYTIHDLGYKYEEMIRQYLYSNDINKLNNIHVAVFVETHEQMPLIQIPLFVKVDGVFIHQFIAPGVAFLVALSGHKKFENNNMISFLKCSLKDAGFLNYIINNIKTVVPKGKFAEHHKMLKEVALESIFYN